MGGGELVVKDNASELAGAGMTGGELAVLGAVQGAVGAGMEGGTIFAKQGSAFDPVSARALPLDDASAGRLRALAGAVKVTALDPAQYVRVVAIAEGRAPAGAPSSPASAHVRVSGSGAGGGPRVTVSQSGDEPKGGSAP